jgi:hypothetical protein
VGSAVVFTGNPALHYDLALRLPDSNPFDGAFAYVAAPNTVTSLIASVP